MSSNKVLNGLFWRFLERCGAQGVTFIVSMVLARRLDETIYGTVALMTVFTTVMQVFVDSGMGNALIQKKDADDLDFSSVFWFNMVMCAVLYIVMFFAAPLIAWFFDTPELTDMLRVMSLILIVSGVKNVQQAYVSRHMLFKRFFFATLGGTLGAAVVGIVMAYNDMGCWALIAQLLFNTTVDTIILWITVKWRPKKQFSFARLKKLFSYGSKLLVSSLLDTLYKELTQLIIGKKYTKADLGQYNKGQEFPKVVVTNVNSSIDSVLLPTMSQAQDNPDHVKKMTRRAIKVSTYVIMPCMVAIAVCAVPLVRLTIGAQWLPCVPYLRVFCFTYAFWPIHTANLNAIKALGRSDLFLKLEIAKKIIGLTAILSTMWISVSAMAYSLLVTSVLSQLINSSPNKKLMKYSYLDQLKDMLPQILLSLAMGAIVYCVSFLGLNDLFTLMIQAAIGVLVYVAGSKLFHLDSFDYLFNILMGFLHKGKKEAKV